MFDAGGLLAPESRHQHRNADRRRFACGDLHTVVVTAANVADIAKTAQLLHGRETQVHADAGYTGVEKRDEITMPNRPIDWQIAGKRGRIKKMAEGPEKEVLKATEKAKASVRAFVEHPFHILIVLIATIIGVFPKKELDRLALGVKRVWEWEAA
jgi:IS5 family transposase